MKLGGCVLVLSLGVSAPLVSGCASGANNGPGCTVTPYISPTTVTVDHSSPAPGNSVQFETGLKYSGNGCVVPESNVVIGYTWKVSDTADASVSSPGGLATCLSAAQAPITVSTFVATYNSAGVLSYVPSGLPSATLTCN